MSETDKLPKESSKEETKLDKFTPKIDSNPIKRHRGEEKLEDTEQSSEEQPKRVKTNNGEIVKEENHDDKNDSKSGTGKDASAEPPRAKFVFGSTSSFGSGFRIADTKKTESNQIKDDESKEPESATTSKPFSFGSGFSFGGGFNVLKNKDSSPNDQDTKEDKNTSIEKLLDQRENSSEEIFNSTIESDKPSIKLEKRHVTSGEESDTLLFQVNAKLYQLTDIKEGWKERGVGPLKINQNKQTKKIRIVMRSRVLLKVILNLPLMKEFKLYTGFPGSLHGEKFVRIIAVNEKNVPIQYAFKVSNAELATELFNQIEKEMPK